MKIWLYKKLKKINASLDLLTKTLVLVQKRMEKMASELDAAMLKLQTEVEETQGAVNSAVTLIQGLADFIRANSANPAALLDLANKLDADQAAIAAAVDANPVPPAPPTV